MSREMREIMMNYIVKTKGISLKELAYMTDGDIEQCVLSNGKYCVVSNRNS
jgi:hypothetical protein